ncbi:MAG TPA: hypothetical protein VHB20_03415 [Verrucomicrobiae bacterium]|jgi:hypothetical protein|nr:hypothetical protein [Verrucomicrobiae bacterium]
MKPGDDKVLHKELARWKAGPPLPPRFQENVWRRIEQAEAARPGPWWRGWLEEVFARRAVALSYMTILLALGLGAGYWHGRAEQRLTQAQLAERYVRTVAPYQEMP